nr:unnamed protein product [Callosobruchus analis]
MFVFNKHIESVSFFRWLVTALSPLSSRSDDGKEIKSFLAIFYNTRQVTGMFFCSQNCRYPFLN